MRLDRRRRRMAVALSLSLAAGACVTGPAPLCQADAQRSISDTLYFGGTTPHGAVTAAQWKAFLGEVVTPRFPQGLTWWEASGQWRTAAGAIEHEAAYVLQIVRPDTGEGERNIHEIVGRYKMQFQQEAVLRVQTPACTSF